MRRVLCGKKSERTEIARSFSGENASEVCRILSVSRSAIYKKKGCAKREEIELEKLVVSTFKKHHGNYGRIRICKEMQSLGKKIGEHKISRILKEHGLEAKGGRKKTKYGKPVQKTEEVSCPRLVTLEDMMACKTPNSIWCSDITETKINGRKMYTCAVLDVGTRRVVGSESDTHMRESLVHRALKMAIGRNPVRAENIVLHTDGGKQFVSKETTRIAKEARFQKSVSRPGTPCDNLLVETLWKTMKREMPSVRHMNFEMAKMEVVKYIEMYYNTDRLHSALGYQSPNDFYKNSTFIV